MLRQTWAESDCDIPRSWKYRNKLLIWLTAFSMGIPDLWVNPEYRTLFCESGINFGGRFGWISLIGCCYMIFFKYIGVWRLTGTLESLFFILDFIGLIFHSGITKFYQPRLNAPVTIVSKSWQNLGFLRIIVWQGSRKVEMTGTTGERALHV